MKKKERKMIQRTFNDLTPEAKIRIREYISQNVDVPTKELAEELCLRSQSIAGIKAWKTMMSFDGLVFP